MRSQRSNDRISTNASAIAYVLLAIALLSSLVVAYQDFQLLFPESDPPSSTGFRWPLNFISLAVLCGVAAGWFVCAQNLRIAKSFRNAVRLGLLAVIALVVIQNPNFEIWSIASAVAFACFWLMLEKMPTSQSSSASSTPLVTTIVGCLLVSSFLYAGVSEKQRRVVDRRLRQNHRQATALAAQQKLEQKVATSAELSDLKSDSETSEEAPASESMALQRTADGREIYRLGSPTADLQLNVFVDYGSTLSRQIDADAENLVAKHPETVSVAFHHFPMCNECNPSVQQTTNANACRAAKAAEAARALYGIDGFRTMHKWLLQRSDFSEDELRSQVSKLGEKTWDEFATVMDSKENLASILSDVVQARTFKVARSPAVLLNRRGIPADGVARFVDEVIQEAAVEMEFQRQQVWNAVIAKDFPPEPQTKTLVHTVRILNPDGSQGSGVVLAVKAPFVYVLTADHVVMDAEATTIETFTTDSFPDVSKSYRGSVVARTDVEDLAVIRFSSGDFPQTRIPLAPANYVATEVVGASTGCQVGEVPSSVADTAKRELIQRGEDTKTVQMWVYEDTPSHPGRSGGPLIDEGGNIIGICSGVSLGKAHFCHSDEIHRFLDENGLVSLVTVSEDVPLPVSP